MATGLAGRVLLSAGDGINDLAGLPSQGQSFCVLIVRISRKNDGASRGLNYFRTKRLPECDSLYPSFVNTQDHPIGDQVLRLVAKVVKDKVREGDLLARYGGEELLTCPGLTLGPAKRS
jgi:hypothetical protein